VIVVSDTSPITNLAAIGQIDLLRQLYTAIIIPSAVYDEMVTVDKLVPGAVEVQSLPWIRKQAVLNPSGVVDLRRNHDEIDLGEAEAIVLAQELNANPPHHPTTPPSANTSPKPSSPRRVEIAMAGRHWGR
jgi:uncharacterized protein